MARSDRHLRQGLASLQALGVVAAAFVKAIVAEAEAGDYDRVVIGAPAPHAPQQLAWSDIASQIINEVKRPILVVSMAE